MATIKNLLIKLGVIADDVDRPIDKTARGLERVARQADSTERSLGGLSGRLGTLGGPLGSFRTMLDSAASAAARITSGVGSLVGRMASMGATLVTGAAALATMSAALASTTVAAVGLVAALAPAGGLLAALPGVILAAGAAMTVWKLATAGLGEAMGAALSGNVEALAAAMSRMSEAGREFIREFDRAVPALRGFQAAAQDAFVGELTGRLQGWIDALGALKPAVSGLAGEMGRIVRSILDIGTSSHGISRLQQVLGDTRTLVGAIREALAPLLTGFLDLGAVGTSWLASMSGGLTDLLTKFGEWMSAVAASGQAWKWMEGARVVLRQLWDIIADLWGIITGFFRAVQVDGQGALGIFASLLDGMHAFVDSAEGQEVIGTIFRALFVVGQALVPVVTALAGALATVAPIIAELAVLIGPILTTAIKALEPALAALGPGLIAVFTELGKAVTTLATNGSLTLIAQSISAILIAVAPLLPALADLLVPILRVLADLIVGYLAPALSTLVGWISQVATAINGGGLSDDHPLSRFAAFVTGTLVPAVADLWDRIVTAFADIAAWVQSNQATFDTWGARIKEICARVVGIWQQIWDVIVAVFTDIVTWVTENQSTWQEWGDRIGSIVTTLGEVISGVWEFIAWAWDKFGGPLLDLIGGVFTGILQVIDGVMQAIRGVIDIVMGAITGDWERAWKGVQDVFGGVWEAIQGILGAAWEAIKLQLSVGLNAIGVTWEEAWARVSRVLGDVWDSMVRNVRQKIDDLVDFFAWLAGNARQKFDDLAGWVRAGVDNAVRHLNDLINFVRGLPGAIVGALGHLGNLLFNVGRDVVMGFWNGFISLWNWVVSQVQTLFGGLADWARRILGIASPSKVFAEIGRQLPAGLAAGIDGSMGLVESAAARMAAAASFDIASGAVSLSAAPAAAFAGGLSSPVPSSGGRSGGTVVENLVLNLNGADLDLRNPGQAARQLLVHIRDGLRELDREQM